MSGIYVRGKRVSQKRYNEMHGAEDSLSDLVRMSIHRLNIDAGAIGARLGLSTRKVHALMFDPPPQEQSRILCADLLELMSERVRTLGVK